MFRELWVPGRGRSWEAQSFPKCETRAQSLAPSHFLYHSSLGEEMSDQKNKTEQNQKLNSLSSPSPRPLFLGNQSL